MARPATSSRRGGPVERVSAGEEAGRPGGSARPPVRRGTTNGNARGGTLERLRRREYLVVTYRADVDLPDWHAAQHGATEVPCGAGIPACRCYRCGKLLSVDTVSPDRIKPGCQGGTYARPNIRPCCEPCNSETGGRTRSYTPAPQFICYVEV